jgi:hypothetical protein
MEKAKLADHLHDLLYAVNRILESALIALSILMLVGCGDKTQSPTNPASFSQISGILVKQDGSVIPHALAMLVPVTADPFTLEKKAVTRYLQATDNNGEFCFNQVPGGWYSLLCSFDGIAAFRDSLEISNSSIFIYDTLRPTGSLAGSLRLRPGDDCRAIAISLRGTPYAVFPQDSAGNFILAGLAQGKYLVRFWDMQEKYRTFDTSLVIVAGKADTLDKPIELAYDGVLKPRNIRLSYNDTLKVVRIEWDPLDTADILGYRVFTLNAVDIFGIRVFLPDDSSWSRASRQVTTQPSFEANIYMPNLPGMPDRHLCFKVVALDKQNNEGDFSDTVGVTITDAFKPIDSICIPGASVGAFTVCDTTIFIAPYLAIGGTNQGTVSILEASISSGSIKQYFGNGLFSRIDKISCTRDRRICVFGSSLQNTDRAIWFDRTGNVLHQMDFSTMPSRSVVPLPSVWFDSSGNMLIPFYKFEMGYSTNMIRKFSPDGNVVDTLNIGDFGYGDIEKFYLSPQNMLYVDCGSMVQFDSSFNFVRIIPSGISPDHFDDKGNLYCCETFFEPYVSLSIYSEDFRLIARTRAQYEFCISGNNRFEISWSPECQAQVMTFPVPE